MHHFHHHSSALDAFLIFIIIWLTVMSLWLIWSDWTWRRPRTKVVEIDGDHRAYAASMMSRHLHTWHTGDEDQ